MDKVYTLLPKQREFLASTAKETLFSGAWGGSKSYALCLAVLREACIPNSQILLVRKTYKALKRSTLITLLEGDNGNPILPQNSYKFNRVDQTIKLNGLNSTIYLAGLDDVQKIRSMNLSFVAVDECSELEESEWQELMGRLRSPNGSRRIVGATNPSSPSHWLYQRFFVNNQLPLLSGQNQENPNESAKVPTRVVVRTSTLENTFLPQDYLDSLKTLPKSLYAKFVEGQWIDNENMIYSDFKRDRHLKHRGHGEFSRYMLGVDWGWSNPCALVLLGIDGDNNVHLLDEEKVNKMIMSQVVSLAEKKYYKLQPEVLIDPSAPALISEFEKAGFQVKKADNSVDDGISRFQNLLHNGKFSAEVDSLEFIKEIENYVRDEKGRPVKVNDHILDAIRYCVNDLVVQDGGFIHPTLTDDIEDEDEMWMEKNY